MKLSVEKKKLLIELQYLPCIQAMGKMTQYEEIVIEAHENYSKGSYRNRCIISSANGPLSLSIPLQKGKNQNLPITSVKIAYNDGWPNQHWRSIQSAYGKSPYFEFYETDLKLIFDKNYEYLFEFNKAIFEFLLENISLDAQVTYTEQYSKIIDSTVLDYRGATSPKLKRNIEDATFQPQHYTQVFEDRFGFLPNLSVLDALFCLGPSTSLYLESCYG